MENQVGKISVLKNFRVVSFIEGISYLVLLFISMPLKYFGGMPKAVTYNGWVHGILFVAFMYFLFFVWEKCGWSFGKIIKAFILGLIPFGTFFLDKDIKKSIAEVEAKIKAA